MGRKKKEVKEKEEEMLRAPRIKREVKNTIWAIVSIVLCLFFILAGINSAGIVGDKLHNGLTYLFGTGYFLSPLFFLVVAISLLRPHDPESRVAATRVVGSVIFFFASLGLVSIFFTDRGGIVGNGMAKPLLSLFDVYASVIILIAILFIALVVIFEKTLSIESFMFWKWFNKEKEEVPGADVEAAAAGAEAAMAPLPEGNAPLEAKAGFSLGKKKKEEASGEGIDVSLFSFSGKEYQAPPLSLLERSSTKPSVGDVKANANLIKRTLANFGIDVEMDEISIGPTVTRYALKPAEGVRLSKILGLQNNLELALAAHPVRIEAPIPGKSLVGIEVPNIAKATVRLAELLAAPDFTGSPKPLLVSLGKGITGKPQYTNIAKAPHMLIAGATGSGKSVTIHAIINSLLFRNSPDMLKLIMVDPKRVELTLYNGIPHLLTPVITEAKKAILALKWAGKEMDRRYDVLENNKVRDIESYHQNVLPDLVKDYEKNSGKEGVKQPDPMPYIVIFVDELADLMQAYPRELESAIVRLAQMSRAVGIHLILSTQRPSVNVITGIIKANIPTRIALQVSSQVDSRTILDTIGAEKLLGAGDMLYMGGEMSKPIRVQSAFISEKEVKDVSKYLADQYEDEVPSEVDLTTASDSATSTDLFAGADDDGGASEDDLYEEAREVVMRAGKASTSFLQRKLRIGYARAARLMDILEEKGVVGPQEGSKPREVLTGVPGGAVTDESQDEE